LLLWRWRRIVYWLLLTLIKGRFAYLYLKLILVF
jgi:hypothetical protein